MLPPLPDEATLQAMAYWGGGGALAGFAAIAFQWIVKPGLFGEPVREEPVDVPGAPKPRDPAPPPWGKAGLSAALIGAVIGALFAWGWNLSPEEQRRIGIAMAVAGVLQALWRLLHVRRDEPAVGEPPPGDPEQTVTARLPGALWGVVAAVAGVAMAWL